MLLSDFDFELPEELIAQQPLVNRCDSRLLHLHLEKKSIDHRQFSDLHQLLQPGDLLVRNETKVIPARLLGQKSSGGKVEFLLVRLIDPEQNIWRCMSRSSKPVKPGSVINFPEKINAEILQNLGEGLSLVKFSSPEDFFTALDKAGHIPLPPYIRREDQLQDRERYQTVFANNPGAVAAPTAGLHFTEAVFAALVERGIETCGVTLHVGPGTFLPVRVENLHEHEMHAEVYDVPETTALTVNRARAEGRRIVALGTTVTRTLESALNESGLLTAGSGETDLFIKPGFRFRMVDALITNFHLPKSTLLVLVSAFAGRDFILEAYRQAVASGYRFFSYGDCMLIE